VTDTKKVNKIFGADNEGLRCWLECDRAASGDKRDLAPPRYFPVCGKKFWESATKKSCQTASIKHFPSRLPECLYKKEIE
jgi:hypothetical protein